MAEKELSAEQQLLSLIETSGGEQAEGAGKNSLKPGKKFLRKKQKKHDGITKRKMPLLDPALIKSRVDFFMEKVNSVLSYQDPELVIDFTKNTLVIAIYALCAVLSLNVIRESKSAKELPSLIPIEKNSKVIPPHLEIPKSFTVYSNKLEQRNLFKIKEKIKIEKKEVKQPQKEPILNKIRQNFKLVGLSPSYIKGESYAMLEDMNKGTTFFVKEGESILGLTVKKITSEKVIFTDGEEDAELR